MEKRIKQLAKNLSGTPDEKAKVIQTMLLYDLNQHVPLSFIKTHME